MAQLDPSIALQVKQPQFEDIGTIRARGLQLQHLQRADEQAQRDLAEQKTIREIYQRSMGGDGQIDNAAFVRGVAQAGLGDRIPGIQKQHLEAEKLRGEVKGTGIKNQDEELVLHKKRLDILNGGLSSLLANPNVTHEQVIAQIGRFVDQGLITEAQGAEAARNVPGRPEQLRPFLVQRALEAADTAKRLEAILPKYDEQDRGGTINQGTIDNLTGTRVPGTDITKTNTPGEVLNAQNVQALAGAGVQYQTDANGNIIALPSKPGGGAITPRPVTDNAGAPVAGKGLNDSQSKALLFASRGQAANKILEGLAAKGVTRPSLMKEVAGAVPGVGGALAAGVNATMVSPEQQQVEQAQRDFINATLRRESGAVISPQEFDNANKQYFVQIGDSPEVIAQKKQNRELAMRGILAEVPEGMRAQIDAPAAPTAPTAPGARPPLDAFFSRPK